VFSVVRPVRHRREADYGLQPFRDPSSSISTLKGMMAMGHFLLHRPVTRRPSPRIISPKTSSAARGVSTGVTSRRTGGRVRGVDQAVEGHETRPNIPAWFSPRG